MKVSRKMNDFGEKIGGARKDLARGITAEDLSSMSNMDINKNITKAKIWGKIDYEELVNNGLQKEVAFFIKTVKDALPGKPAGISPEKAKEYIDFINEFKTMLLELKDTKDIENFFKDKIITKYVENPSGRSRSFILKPQYSNLMTNKLFKATQVPSLARLQSDMQKKQFLLSKDEKDIENALEKFPIFQYKENTEWNFDRNSVYFGQNQGYSTYFMYPKGELSSPDAWEPNTWYVKISHREFKNNFPTKEAAKEFAVKYYKQNQLDKKEKRLTDTVPHLAHIKQEIPHYHGISTVTTDALQDTFNFRGGEFGNYENVKDRTKNVTFSYDAFCALAETLNISVKDIPFNNRLAIAYGARGRGGKNAALAHYEPEKRVINLTRFKGAGSLAHEWMHGLDHYLCNLELPNVEKGLTASEVTDSKYLLSNNEYSNNILSSIVTTMKFRTIKMCESNDPRYNYLITKQKIYLQRALREFDYKLPEDKITILEGILKEFQNSLLEFDDYRALNDDSKELKPSIEKLIKDLSDLTDEHLDRADGRIDTIVYNQADLSDKIQKQGQEKIVVPTKFLSDSRTLDSVFKSNSTLYYSTNHEMLARAFACYVKDKLAEQGRFVDYLCGHADSLKWSPEELCIRRPDEKVISASPLGEERKLINKEFDKLFELLKEKEIFTEFNSKEITLYSEAQRDKSNSSDANGNTIENEENLKKTEPQSYDHVEQMSIFDFDVEK